MVNFAKLLLRNKGRYWAESIRRTDSPLFHISCIFIKQIFCPWLVLDLLRLVKRLTAGALFGY